ncbi:hypothetical protein [uncultured Aminobacterium sp.]|jgi:hypothetical protein|uniref:hypothetical protein n=1 Tax=uncultured Aminobacterium sp. TaxID=548265 RepID=UPI002596992C|nr:hypothetical protein [uncultured Aminobacterium sp.]
MGIEQKIEGYAFTMLVIQLAFVLINLAGLYPYTLEIAGFSVYDDIHETTNSIQTAYEEVAGAGILANTAITAYMLIMGVKIILEFLMLTLIGAYPLLVALGLPAAFAIPVAALIGAVTVYGLAIKFLGR